MQTIQNFNVGDVYYYNPSKFLRKEDYHKPDKFQDFISERPVVIIGTNVDGYGSVRVVQMTTQDEHCGIKIMMPSGRISVIKPYKIHTISRSYLETYHGRLPDDILKVLMECVAFHMGFSDKVPEYLMIDSSISISHSEGIEYSYRTRELTPVPDKNTHKVLNEAKQSSTKPLQFNDNKPKPIRLVDIPKLTKEEIKDKAIEMYLNNVTIANITQETGVSISTLYNVIRQRGIERRKPRKSESTSVEIVHIPMMASNSCRPYKMPTASIRAVVEKLSISEVYKIGRKSTINDLMDDYTVTYEQAKELKTYCFKTSQRNERALYKNFRSGYKFDRVDEWDIVIVNNRPEDILLSKGLTKEDIKKIRDIGEARKIITPPHQYSIC